MDTNACIGVTKSPGAGDVGADVVAFDQVAGPGDPHADTVEAIAADNVSGRGRRPADGVAR